MHKLFQSLKDLTFNSSSGIDQNYLFKNHVKNNSHSYEKYKPSFNAACISQWNQIQTAHTPEGGREFRLKTRISLPLAVHCVHTAAVLRFTNYYYYLFLFFFLFFWGGGRGIQWADQHARQGVVLGGHSN